MAMRAGRLTASPFPVESPPSHRPRSGRHYSRGGCDAVGSAGDVLSSPAMTVQIRPARADDAGDICRIYNQGIEDRVATLETELRTPEERRQWLAARGLRHPVVVAESPDGAIVGWASLNVFNAREAYRFVADLSIYIDRSARGKGIGHVLLDRIVELGRQHGFHKIVLSAFPTNTPGMALYTRLGFRTVGVYKEQGQLDGRWVDTIIMERLLDG